MHILAQLPGLPVIFTLPMDLCCDLFAGLALEPRLAGSAKMPIKLDEVLPSVQGVDLWPCLPTVGVCQPHELRIVVVGLLAHLGNQSWGRFVVERDTVWERAPRCGIMLPVVLGDIDAGGLSPRVAPDLLHLAAIGPD